MSNCAYLYHAVQLASVRFWPKIMLQEQLLHEQLFQEQLLPEHE